MGMNREEICKYVYEKYHTSFEYLWKKYPFYAVLRGENQKWYGIIMNVPREKLGLTGKEEVDILNVKCPKELVGSFRMSPGILPAYHMNKENWLTILLDGSVSKEKILQLLDWSHDLVE